MSGLIQSRTAAALADRLFFIRAVEFGSFRTAYHERRPNAPSAPHRFNLRTHTHPSPGPLKPTELNTVGHALACLTDKQQLRFERVAGVPSAGNPLAITVTRIMGMERESVFLLRERIDGAWHISGVNYLSVGFWPWGEPRIFPDEPILLLDDIVSGADAKVEAIRVLRAAGFRVEDIIVVIDQEEGGARELREITGCRVHALFGARELLRHYFARGWLRSETLACSMDYLAAFPSGS